MADSPFKVGKPSTVNVGSGVSVKSPSKGDVFRHALAEGEELYEAAREEHAPDHLVGPGASKPTDKGQIGEHKVPDHPAAIPWPAAQPVTSSPMRLKK